MARISCQNQLILDAWRRYLATNRRFSCPRSLWECIRAQSCHRQTPGNAFREHLAAAEQPRTRRGHVRIPECIGGCGCGGGAGGRRDHAGAAGAAGEGGGVEVRGGISAPSVERGNRRPQACAAAGRDGGRGPSATRVRMNPFTPTFFRCGIVIKFICYVTNK